MATASDEGGEPVDETDETSDAGAEEETGVAYEVSSEDRTWGILVHASALIGLVIPFGNIVAPLVIWLIKREESQFVDENGIQSMNFQITWTILLVIAGLSLLIGVGLVLVPVLGLAWVILVVLATVRASKEEVYDYPLTIDLIS